MNIIELAKQAGLKRHQEQAPSIDGVVGNWADLERFAALVAAQQPAQPQQEFVGTVKELFTDSSWNRLNLRGSTKVWLDKE